MGKPVSPSSSVSRGWRHGVWRGCALLSAVLIAAGAMAASEGGSGPMLFSTVMQRVSEQPGFHDTVLNGMRDVRFGEFLSPALIERLRVLILGREWQRVDHFPALTVGALNASVGTVTKLAGKDMQPLKPADLLDVGAYTLGKTETIDLERPATQPSYANDPQTAPKPLGFDLTMGDGPDPALAPMHAASYELAAVLNRLAMNAPGQPEAAADFAGHRITDGAALMAALEATGHHVTITDVVYFANFGHLHYAGREVMMPFWIDTQIAVPATRRSLLLPVSHSEQEIHIRGPVWNADVSFYYGIDGKAEFRTMDELNQSWVMHRALHTYSEPARQRQVIDLLSAAARVYYAVRMAHPELPFGGYYRLGVCQDVGAVVETVLEGRTQLFPITHDEAYFPRTNPGDVRDDLFLKTFAAVPSDRGSGMPPVDRVLGAVPTTDYAAILIPGLGQDLERVEVARRLGLNQRTHPLLTLLLWVVLGLAAVALAAWWLWRRLRRHRTQAA